MHSQYSEEISELQSRSHLGNPTISYTGSQSLLMLWHSCSLAKEVARTMVDKTKLSAFQIANSFVAWTMSSVQCAASGTARSVSKQSLILTFQGKVCLNPLLTYPVSSQQPERFYFRYPLCFTKDTCFCLLHASYPCTMILPFQISLQSPQFPVRHPVLSTSVFLPAFPFQFSVNRQVLSLTVSIFVTFQSRNNSCHLALLPNVCTFF